MPPADKALKLAKALEVSVDFLVNGFEEKTESSIQQKSPFSIELLVQTILINTCKINKCIV